MSTYTIPITKSYRLTSKNANKNKRKLIYKIFDEIKSIKNEMSEYIYNNKHMLFTTEDTKILIKDYTLWNNKVPELYSHAIQALFHDIVKLYKNHIKQIVNNIADKIRIYKQGSLLPKSKKKKSQIQFVKNTDAVKLVKYLFKASKLIEYTDIKSVEDKLNEDLKKTWNKIKYKDRLLKIVNIKIHRAKKKIKRIEFTTGSFRLTYPEFKIVEDKPNTLYKFFLKLPFRNKEIYLPLLLERNPKRKRTKRYFDKILSGNLNKQIFLIDRRNSTKSKKLFFAVTRNEELTFKDIGKILGCDVNLTSEKFITASNGITVSFDENIMKEFLEFISQIDKKGYKNLTDKEKYKLKKYVKIMDWYLRKIIAEFINEVAKDGYTDIVLEDLASFRNGKFKINLFGYEMKLNRFVRFVKLTGLKNIFIQIAHNRGVRVHLTKSSYTSQMCPRCGNIDRDNRTSQSKFKCTNCGFEYDADFVASINILLRYMYAAYRNKLHNINKDTKELEPKIMSNGSFKDVLSKLFDKTIINNLIQSLVDVLPESFVRTYYSDVSSSGHLSGR